MNAEELDRLRREGEGQRLEFKADLPRPESIAEEIVALANSEGGLILFGVADDGTIAGLPLPDRRRTEEHLINIARNNVEPSLPIEVDETNAGGNIVLALRVPSGFDKPYRARHNSKVYLRVGSTKREASREEHFRLYQASDWLKYDSFPLSYTGLTDLDLDKVARFFSRSYGRPLERPPDERLLLNLEIFNRLGDQPRATVAGILLFGREPQRHLPQSGIDLVRYRGAAVGPDIADRANLDGTLDELIDGAAAFVKRNMRLAGHIEGTQRRDVPEYPLEAVREAITNAVAHRDYSIAGSRIRVFMFDDRLEVISPGRLPNTINLENIAYRQYSRNRLVMEFLLKLGYVERLGAGIALMTRRMVEENGQPPEFEVRGEEFVVRLRARAL